MGKDFTESYWYCVKLYTLKTYEVRDYFAHAGLQAFIPEQKVMEEDSNGKRHQILKPVVSNLVFVRVGEDNELIAKLMTTDKYKMSLVKPYPSAKCPAIINDKEMNEFQMMCNPDIEMKEYISEEEAKLKTGDEVTVTHGPLSGLSGRLVRKSHKYYLLKEVPGMGVMLKVSRWCCKKKCKK